MGFDDVQRSASERAGMRVHWNNGSADDQEAQAAVRSLLEEELTADETVQIALLNNRGLQAVYEELDIAQADLVQAGLLKNPVFSGQVRFATSGDGTAAVLDLTQEFVSLLFMPLRKGRAEAAFEAAKLRVTGAVLDLAGEARAAFYQLQAAEQLLEMRRTVVEATQASYELSKRLREAGNNRDLDVSNERALHEQSKLDLAAAEAAVVQRREELNVIMGLWGADTDWRIASRLPTIPSDEMPGDDLEHRAVEQSLDLAIARREIEVAARAVGIARPLGLLAELDAGVAAERELEGGWSVGPSISLPIPLFDQGQAAVGSAQARLRQAAERYAATAVSLRAGIRAAYA
ncbi:MAG: TolC family protein, partial [Myxococcota bacterium]